MNTLKESLPVMFRKCQDGEVLAVFPTEPYSRSRPYAVSCYAHVGQHSGADWDYVMTKTKPAKPEEYAPLLRELKGIYESEPDAVTLKVIQRRPKTRWN